MAPTLAEGALFILDGLAMKKGKAPSHLALA
jgi:hypothetical protein